MRLPLRKLLLSMLFMPVVLIAQESIPEKPLAEQEPLSEQEATTEGQKKTSSNDDIKQDVEASEDVAAPLPSDI